MQDMQPSSSVNWARVQRLVWYCVFFITLTVLGAVLYRALLLSLSLSLFLSYLLAPLVDWITERHHARRPWVVSLLIVTLLSLVAVLVASLLPEIYGQFLGILKLMPKALEFLIERVEPLKHMAVASGFIGLEEIDRAVAQFNPVRQVTGQIQGAMETLWSSTPTLLGGVINFGLVPVLMFFILNDLPKLQAALTDMTPPDLRVSMRQFVERIDRTLRSVLKGQVMVALTLAVLYMAGLSAIQLKSGLAIGAIAGICRIVPYLDVMVGISLSLIVIITQTSGFGQLVGVLVVFLVVQVMDGMIITPRIIGERAGLHPGVVIGSVIAFGDWFGFVGILIAVPVVAILKVLVQISFPYYRLTPFYAAAPEAQPGNSEPGQT